MSYIGKSPTGTGVRSRYYYTATGGETSISGADDSGATLTFTDGAYVDVYLNGVLLVAGTDYNTSTANTIGGLASLAGSDIVEVLVYDTFTVADAVKASSGGTFNGAVTVTGTVTADGLTVDTDTLYVDSTNNRVGIGTASPTSSKLQVDGTDGTIARFRTTSGANNTVINITSSDAAETAGFSVGGNASFPAMTFENGGTEAMRIDSSGKLLLGTTSVTSGILNAVYSGTYGIDLRGGSGASTLQLFFAGATNVGSISTNGTSTAFNTSSDYRLKENVTDISDATIRLKQLNPVRFNFISNPDRVVDGFLAHEVQDVVPEAISGTKDEVDDEGNPVYQGIDQSKLVPLLVKTIQELEARIAALENA